MTDHLSTPDGWKLTPPPGSVFDDPVRALLAAAGEALRAAVHDGTAPGEPADLRFQVAELTDVLFKASSVANRLSTQARRMGQRTDLTGDAPEAAMELCALKLDHAAGDAGQAAAVVSAAQSAITWDGAR